MLVADVSVPGADEHPEAGPEARTRPLPAHGSDPPCARPHSCWTAGFFLHSSVLEPGTARISGAFDVLLQLCFYDLVVQYFVSKQLGCKMYNVEVV